MILPLLLATLATYRISRMIVAEYGPLNIFERLRQWATPHDWISDGLSCPLCVSFWIALPMAFLAVALWQYVIVKIILSWLAIAGLNVIIYRTIET